MTGVREQEISIQVTQDHYSHLPGWHTAQPAQSHGSLVSEDGDAVHFSSCGSVRQSVSPFRL